MSKIKIKDLSGSGKMSKKAMKKAKGGASLTSQPVTSAGILSSSIVSPGTVTLNKTRISGGMLGSCR